MVSVVDALRGAVAAISTAMLYLMAKNDYARIAGSTPIPIDAYVGEVPPAFSDQLQCVLIHWYTRLTRKIHSDPFAIVAEEDPHIPGLHRTRAAKPKELPTKTDKPQAPLVIGTIRT